MIENNLAAFFVALALFTYSEGLPDTLRWATIKHVNKWIVAHESGIRRRIGL